MQLIIHKPYLILWLSIPLILVITIIRGAEVIDLQFHETYFVIDPPGLGGLFALLFGALGCIYWVTRSLDLVPELTIVHVLGTVLSTLALLLLILHAQDFGLDSGPYAPTSFKLYLLPAALLIWTGSQCLFIINFLIGIIRNTKT